MPLSTMVVEDQGSPFTIISNSDILIKSESLSNFPNTINKTESKLDKDFIIHELTHDEVDLNIQFNRVMYVLKRCIEKIKVVAYMPMFLEDNGKVLKRYFDDETVHFILNTCDKDIVLMDNIGQRPFQLRKKDTSPILKTSKIDQSMLEIISLLYSNKAIKKEIVENDDVNFSEGATKLIETMNLLYSACKEKLQMSAAHEKNRQHKLRRAWRNNVIIKKEIQNLEKKLREQRETFAKDIYEKKKIIADYHEKMEIVKDKFKEKMNAKVAESEKLMGLEAAASEIKISYLSIEAKQLQAEYEILLENNIADEKGLRAKRLKIETQLATWLAKYDQDIGERFYEIEELTEAYEKEKAEVDAIQHLLDEQEEEYEELMEEKAAEDRRIFEIKMYRILSNIAARKIQKTWKKYWVRKQARMKAKRERAKNRKMGIILPKKAKKKKKGKKKISVVTKTRRESNLVDDLSKMYSKKSELFDELTTPAFDKTPVNVEL